MDIYIVVELAWGGAAGVVRSRGVLVKNGTVRVKRVEGERVWLPGNVRVMIADGRSV
jgi:hypothetical protein